MKTKVFGLFVGINAYNPRIVIDKMAMFPALGGCVNDVEAIRDALAADPDLDLRVKMLTDEDATKAAIVAQFDEHLGQAGPDDVALFYFSGHGTVEKANAAIWTAEHDNRLEGIVCYYTENQSSKFLLCDKELRYLLARLSGKTQAHIVTIFDCCHSGDNTRSPIDLLADQSEDADKVKRKQIDIVFPQRDWSDFIFADTLGEEDFKGKGIDEVLPPGRYIQLSACESNEPALEVNGHGVLTDHLLKALKQTRGYLTYRDLSSRIRNQVRYLFTQRPRVYTPNIATALTDMGFLKKPAGVTATDATLVFNGAGEIRIDRGRVHHVEAGLTTVTVTGKDGMPVTGRVKLADLDAAVVEFDRNLLANLKREPQSAKLGNLSQRVVRVHVDNRDKPNAPFKRVMDALAAPQNANYFAFEDDPAKADYTLVKHRNLYFFSLPADTTRPLIMPLRSSTPDLGSVLAGHLRHISQWKYAEQLRNNSATALPETALKIEVFDGETGAPLAPDHGAVHPVLSEKSLPNSPQKSWRGSIKVKLTNQTPGDLYVAALYQSYDFSCNTHALLDPAVIMLEQGQSKFLFDHRTQPVIPLKLDDSIRMFNWRESRETLKFVFSTEQFDLSALELNGLPSPAGMFKRGGLDLSEDTPESGAALNGWATRDLVLQVANPLFNTVDEAALRALLDANPNPGTSAIAYFMLALYFEKNTSGKWQLKPGLKSLGGLESAGDQSLEQRAEAWEAFWAAEVE